MNWLQGLNWTLIFGVLFGVSEALALVPAIKSNSVFQVILGLLAKLSGKQVPPS